MSIVSSYNIRHNGEYFPAGTIISEKDMDAKSQRQLVEDGMAEYVSDPVDRLSVKELTKHLSELTDIAEVEALLEGEDRKTAIEAIEKRIEELVAEQLASQITEAVGLINEMTDIEELEKLSVDETREAVHAAIEKRIAELKENA